MTMLREVGKPFEADGILYQPGDVVDVSDWPVLKIPRLESLRFLRTAPEGATVTVVPSERVRVEGDTSFLDRQIAAVAASHDADKRDPITDADGNVVEPEPQQEPTGEKPEQPEGESPEKPEPEQKPEPKPEPKPRATTTPAKKAAPAKKATAPRKAPSTRSKP